MAVSYEKRLESLQLIEGHKVHVKLVGSEQELSLMMEEMQPNCVMMMETYLDYMRVCEVYYARRLQ